MTSHVGYYNILIDGGNLPASPAGDKTDGDTFDVSPGWQWNGQQGSRVRPTGYDAPKLYELSGQDARDKLAQPILWQNVELGNAYRVDRGRLVCDVFFNGHNLAAFFPEYR